MDNELCVTPLSQGFLLRAQVNEEGGRVDERGFQHCKRSGMAEPLEEAHQPRMGRLSSNWEDYVRVCVEGKRRV